MRTIYCFRCGCEVPGFDAQEEAELRALWKAACQRYREYEGDINMWELGKTARFSPHFVDVRDRYAAIAGVEMQTRCMEFFHSLESLGTSCPACGKTLRTKKAKMCFHCGWRAESTSVSDTTQARGPTST